MRMFILAVVIALAVIQITSDTPVLAICEYKFDKTGECAPIQSVSIDRIDFEIVAEDVVDSSGITMPTCQ